MTDGVASYYGRPIVKEPVWKPEIPLYFFFGGLAGAAATLQLGARLAGRPELARRALLVNTAAISISPLLLIKDLGRPQRFYNMLRVVKPTSPMNIGTWIVSASGTASGLATATHLLGRFPRLQTASETVAGLLGPFLSTYTAALVADSVVPAWHEARRELPLVFAAGSAASAGAATAIVSPPEIARPARRLAVLGGVGELAAAKLMEKRLGDLVGSVYHEGKAGRYSKLAQATTLAGTVLMGRAGRRGRLGAIAGGSLLLAGSLCERFAVYHAGKQSARNPHHTSIPQKQRAGRAVTQPSRRAGNGSSPEASTR